MAIPQAIHWVPRDTPSQDMAFWVLPVPVPGFAAHQASEARPPIIVPSCVDHCPMALGHWAIAAWLKATIRTANKTILKIFIDLPPSFRAKL